MTKKKPLVVVTRKLPDVVETRMRELFDAQLNVTDAPMTQAALIEAVKTADVLVPTVTDRIDASVLAQAGDKLRLIANFGNGVDNIDVQTALSRGITVTNTPGVLTEDTADMTMALILAVARRIAEGSRVIPDEAWNGWSPTWMLGHRITGKRLGIVGMGRIGQALARRARAFGLQVHYHNRRRVSAPIEEALEATYWDSLDQMLARMDVVSVNCPHTPATYHLLSARRLKLLKRDAIVVNTARGEIIDESALTRMLEAGEIAGAGLDVFEHEPAISPRLLKLARQHRVVVLPHMGSATIEGRVDMGEKVIVNIKTFMDGHRRPTASCRPCSDVLDHVSIAVADMPRAIQFYDAALGALGVVRVGADEAWAGYGTRCDAQRPGLTYLSLRRVAGPVTGPGRHWAFKAPDRRLSTGSGRRVWPRAARTTARRACAGTTTRPTTPPSCSTPTATASRPCATASRSRAREATRP